MKEINIHSRHIEFMFRLAAHYSISKTYTIKHNEGTIVYWYWNQNGACLVLQDAAKGTRLLRFNLG